MPSVLADELAKTTVDDSFYQPYGDNRPSQDKINAKAWPSQQPPGIRSNYETTPPRTPTESINSTNGEPASSSAGMYTDTNSGLNVVPNGRSSGSWENRSAARNTSTVSVNGTIRGSFENGGRRSPGPMNGLAKTVTNDRTSVVSVNGSAIYSQSISTAQPSINSDGDVNKRHGQPPVAYNLPNNAPLSPPNTTEIPISPARNSSVHRFSAPEHPLKSLTTSTGEPVPAPFGTAGPPQLKHRHTLQVPKPGAGGARGSVDESSIATGRFSPTVFSGRRRGSLSLNRRNTQSIHSNMPEDIVQDEDALRWAEAIRQKRASKRKREDDEDEDRVVVGTKVDQHHVNWVTAYNMLTGIRFTVSRTNAKMDRALTDADFTAKHKFSFDITGNELTPSAKYDFKFKDYAPWVFRHLRAKFKIDPADYLMSLTSKYILSELGSPGKSGSFFYFSRDYKYIIKTIHHAEHRLLRKILKDYYNHIEDNPNTLLSQFYGLHRVKIPYGKKIHFVVMNNLFPPHRDIHQTFDLKGSTVGRDFKEEELAKNPRATLKDLNWLRRNYHLEFGPEKKNVFLEQMEKDVHLLQKMKIMDYSMLVGIHDLAKGNEENIRDKTLQVFQPGGEDHDPSLGPTDPKLLRTPSKLETARKAQQLRQIVKQEKPVPMHQTPSRMPELLQENTTKREFFFYSDDGGFRATHEDNTPGNEIYYLGIIDLLTHYSTLKKLEHFWKGLSHDRTQISPINPVPYGERFINFMRGITKSPEEAAREAAEAEKSKQTTESARYPHENESNESKSDPVENRMGDNEHEAHKSEQRGASERDVPDRTLMAQNIPARAPSTDRAGERGGMTLPIVEEAGEGSSTGARSNRSDSGQGDRPPPTPPKDVQDGHLSPIGRMLQPPAVPPKEPSLRSRSSLQSTRSFDSNKALPMLPKERLQEGEQRRMEVPVKETQMNEYGQYDVQVPQSQPQPQALAVPPIRQMLPPRDQSREGRTNENIEYGQAR